MVCLSSRRDRTFPAVHNPVSKDSYSRIKGRAMFGQLRINGRGCSLGYA